MTFKNPEFEPLQLEPLPSGWSDWVSGDYVQECLSDLKRKQDRLDKMGMGKKGRWEIDERNRLLRFFDARDKLHLEADFAMLGSFATPDHGIFSFLWSWANQQAPADLKRHGKTFKLLKGLTNRDEFVQSGFICDEADVWVLAAVAAKEFCGEGFYVARDERVSPFLFLDRVRKR